MNVDVTVNGRAWRVGVEPDDRPGRVRTSIKGRRRLFDVARIDADTLSLVEVDGASRRVYEVAIDVRNGEQRFRVRGAGFEVRTHDPGQGTRHAARSAGPRESASHRGPKEVSAPMPGRVVKVLVSTGDRVTVRQPVVVIEAMKMENELRAGKDGVVVDVRVSENTAVEKDAVLVVID